MKKNIILSFLTLSICSYSFSQSPKASLTEISTISVFNGVSNDEYPLKEVKAHKVVASSTLPSKSNLYDKKHLTDNNNSTAWVEGSEGYGEGENITFFFKENIPPDVIKIIPGYLKDANTWNKNTRVAKITIRMYQNEENADGDGLLDEYVIDLVLQDDGTVPQKPQYIDLSNQYLHNMAYTEFESVEVTITGVDSKNAKYKDTCISAIEFFVKEN